MSVTNQKTLIINKEPATTIFLQIEMTDWIYAKCDLTYAAFSVYLYLASNANGYHFEYSPQAIENTGMMSKGTATKARQELEAKGYIIGNNFYVRPPKHQAEIDARKYGTPTGDDF